MKKRLPILSLALSLTVVVSACSQPAADQPTAPAADAVKAATTPEGMITEGPGQFAGSRYDEAKVQQQLKKWPKGLTADQLYSRLIGLLAEDYEPIIKKAKEYKPPFELSKLGNQDPLQSTEKREQKKNVAILIDSSGSMAGTVDGKTKMEQAKQAVKEFAQSLPKNIRVSVSVYGHQGSNAEKDKNVSCSSVEERYPLSPYQPGKFNQVIDSLKPVGWTPLASAIKQAAKIFNQSQPGEENVVYVVSDGIESCGGDPVKEAEALHKSNIQAIVNIIGLNVDSPSQTALQKVANAGGGQFTNARSGADLKDSMNIWTYFGNAQQVIHWQFDNQVRLTSERQAAYETIWNWLGTSSNYGDFDTLWETEREHMEKAIRFLSEQKIIPEAMSSYDGALTEKLINRRKQLNQYRDQLKQEKIDEIDNSYRHLSELMDKIKRDQLK